MGDDPKKEGNKSLRVFIPRRRVGTVDIVKGNFDIFSPVSVFAFSMEISIVAQSGYKIFNSKARLGKVIKIKRSLRVESIVREWVSSLKERNFTDVL